MSKSIAGFESSVVFILRASSHSTASIIMFVSLLICSLILVHSFLHSFMFMALLSDPTDRPVVVSAASWAVFDAAATKAETGSEKRNLARMDSRNATRPDIWVLKNHFRSACTNPIMTSGKQRCLASSYLSEKEKGCQFVVLIGRRCRTKAKQSKTVVALSRKCIRACKQHKHTHTQCVIGRHTNRFV